MIFSSLVFFCWGGQKPIMELNAINTTTKNPQIWCFSFYSWNIYIWCLIWLETSIHLRQFLDIFDNKYLCTDKYAISWRIYPWLLTVRNEHTHTKNTFAIMHGTYKWYIYNRRSLVTLHLRYVGKHGKYAGLSINPIKSNSTCFFLFVCLLFIIRVFNATQPHKIIQFGQSTNNVCICIEVLSLFEGRLGHGVLIWMSQIRSWIRKHLLSYERGILFTNLTPHFHRRQ